MKKIYLLSLCLFISVATLFGQQKGILLKETFNGTGLPSGWAVSGAGTGNWKISQSKKAGGEPNELHLNWSPQFNGMSRFTSPAIDLTGNSKVILELKHSLDHFDGNVQMGVATSSDNGATWNNAWVNTYNSSKTESIIYLIENADMNKNNVKFCIFFNGSSYNINNWYFDDFSISSVDNLDASVSSITFPKYSTPGENTVKFKVTSFGEEQITSVKAKLKINGIVVDNEEFTGLTINTANASEIEFTNKLNIPVPGTYNIEVELVEINGIQDAVAENNSFIFTNNTVMGITQRYPMIEIFSSSTCPPCVSYNIAMTSFLNANQGQLGVVKYQMNWPGNGDPYYTAEGGKRKDYYGINSVPAGVIDGEAGFSANQTVFNNAKQQLSFLEINGNYTISGNTINVDFDVTSFTNLQDANVIAIVSEKLTTGNVGSNGETSFHHVMMKMLPNGDGTFTDLVGGEPKHFTFSQDMTGTHVEEMDDLEVVVFVQEHASKYMYNSKFLTKTTQALTPVTLAGSYNAASNEINLTWNAPTNAVSYNVYVNGELAGNQTTLNYTVNNANSKEIWNCAVEAVYPGDLLSVKSMVMVVIPQSYEPVVNLTTPSNARIEWEKPTNGEPISYKIMVNNELRDYTNKLFYEFNDITDANICVIAVYFSGESAETCIPVTWVSTNLTDYNFVIYPNPANNYVYIKGIDIKEIHIFNNVGKFIKSYRNVSSINVSDFIPGIYNLKIVTNSDKIINSRIVVTK